MGTRLHIVGAEPWYYTQRTNYSVFRETHTQICTYRYMYVHGQDGQWLTRMKHMIIHRKQINHIRIVIRDKLRKSNLDILVNHEHNILVELGSSADEERR